MRIDHVVLGSDLGEVAASARAAEERGYDAWFTGETAHDALLSCVVAAEHTERIEVGTAIAIAFARSPMQTAYAAFDLQRWSGGRFVLGLGSQIQPHIEKRFGMPWTDPAARMREYIHALRAIWQAWETQERLEFRGEHYRHTLMTPFFAPAPTGLPRPRVYLAAVGEAMTRVAGEVADGIFCHGFTTQRYLEEVTLPALEVGAARAGRTLDDIQVSLPVFVVSGHDERERDDALGLVRSQIAFYGSTPSYWGVLELHGWGDLGRELNRLSKQGEWATMATLIEDDVVAAFAVTADPDDLATAVRDRYADTLDRLSLYTSFDFTDEEWQRFLVELRG